MTKLEIVMWFYLAIGFCVSVAAVWNEEKGFRGLIYMILIALTWPFYFLFDGDSNIEDYE